MPNLVGIGNSQVPTNAMLGGLAYQDSVGEIDLEKIKARISGTAVDIFVYDTRKDSDGGAWRHRTQNTSWYNEVPSMTRGARKEFPAVAVIVVTGGAAYEPAITIYDGDDPNLPMWMVFHNRYIAGGNDQTTSVSYYAAGPYPIRKIAMLNGVMVDCQYRSPSHIANIVKGVTRYNFIDDSSIMMTDEGDFKREGNLGDLRNTERAYTRISGSEIVHTQCNDIAITVLPNAPIDDTTGLPRPTIAVATDGGVSVIKDNGYAVVSDSSIYGRPIVKQINFKGERLVGLVHQTGNTSDGVLFIEPLSRIPFPEGTDTRYPFFVSSDSALTLDAVDTNGNHPIEVASESVLVGGNEGLGIIKENKDSPTNGMLAHIAKDFNTGYQHGYIRTTLLSDTTVEVMNESSASELLTNGQNWTGASGTTAPNGWTSAGHAESAFTIDSGRLKIGNGASNNMTAMHQNVTTVVGTTYTLYFNYELHSSAQYAIIRVGTATLNGSLGYFYGTTQSNVQSTITFKATTTSTNISVQLQATSGNAYIWVDNMSVKAIGDINRSSKPAAAGSNGLAVHGKIEKHVVATGAELVGYRPDSSSQGTNYLKLPLTSSIFDLTGDWSINFWAKNNNPGVAQNYSGFEISPDDISSNNAYSIIPFSMYIAGNGLIGLRGAGITGLDSTYNCLPLKDVWRCFSIVRKGTNLHLYIDGRLDGSTSGTFANPSVPYALNIFRWTYSTTRHDGRRHIDFSLFRMSETAPSADQVKKIYDDEKHLFQKNAKCTLYGTTNDIDAIAYDDSTDIVHVGTLSGRSDFNGLVRINNTTRGISTQLSASNGLVAEQ